MSFWRKTSFVIALCFWALSCKPSPTAKILLDFSSLIYQAAIENSRVDEIALSIIGTDPPFELHETYAGDTDLIELSLDPGHNLEFTIQTFQRNDGEAHINYEGSQTATLVANSISELIIDVHKVGTIRGTIHSVFNLEEEHTVELFLEPEESQNAESQIKLNVEENSFSAVVPIGEYFILGTLAAPDQDYELASEVVAEVLHGDTTDVTTLFFRDPNAENDCWAGFYTPDRDEDGFTCDQDCDDTTDACGSKNDWNCTDTDQDGRPHCEDDCTIFILPDTTTTCILKTCGNGSIDIGETCDGDCPTECPPSAGCSIRTRQGHSELCLVECVETTTPGCSIGGDCFEPGFINPDNTCEICDPERNDQGYSLRTGEVCLIGSCTQNICSDAGECTVVNDITCETGLSCNPNNNNVCECVPGTTYCQGDSEPYQSLTCSLSGTTIEVEDCPFRCASPAGICIENRQLTNLTTSVSNAQVTLHWDAIQAQAGDIEYKIEWWSEELEWSFLANTTEISYGPFSPGLDGNYSFRVRGVDSGIEMAYSSRVELTFDTTSPTVVSLTPNSENTNVALSPVLKVEYSEPVQVSSVTFNGSDSIQTCDSSHTIWLQKAGYEDCYPLALREETEPNLFTFDLAGGIQLTANTLYRFSARVGVLDLAGNPIQTESHEEFTTTAPLSSVTKVVLFAAPPTDGNLGARETADATCHTYLTNSPQAATCNNVFAFVSYSEFDSIARMDTTYGFDTSVPIWSLADVQIAYTWTNLFQNNGLTVSLEDAGVFGVGVQGDNPKWWSGSNQDGTHNSQNCNNWTTNSDDVGGMFGDGRKEDLKWISDGDKNCDNLNWLLCACTATSQ